jgi:uncharacterized YigZ family protein
VKTLAANATVEVEIKRSRFVAHAARVDSLADTLAFYESVADPSATHNCWAWKLGHQYRFNDDGEPGGSAGKPIFSTIEGKGLDHVMVVVTRYYGGIKLGVGGLVRAYSGTSARCIDQAGSVDEQPKLVCEIEAGFKWTGQVYSALEQCGARRLGEEYPAGGVLVRAELLESEVAGLRRQLGDATRGEAVVRIAAVN